MNQRCLKAFIIILMTLVTAAIAGCSRNNNQAPSFDDGRQLYMANCASCHGVDGSGGKLIGSAIAADLRAQRLGETYGFNMALVRRAILDGKNVNGTDLNPAMPRFRGKLTEADATNIIVFMESLRVPPSTEVPPDEGTGH